MTGKKDSVSSKFQGAKKPQTRKKTALYMLALFVGYVSGATLKISFHAVLSFCHALVMAVRASQKAD